MRTVLTTFVVMILTFVGHEAAHAFAGKALGYDMNAGINSVSVVGDYTSGAHAVLVTIAGPLFTLAAALLAALIARAGSITAFWIVFCAVFMRTLAQVVSLANPNDEMWVSMQVGIGAWTLPATIMVMLLILLIWSARGARPRVWQWPLAAVGASAAATLVILSEPHLPRITF